MARIASKLRRRSAGIPPWKALWHEAERQNLLIISKYLRHIGQALIDETCERACRLLGE
jgi:hypothetical protein